ncbi:Monoacylglycerol lipase ABHD12, partial [Stegodyphus mimosarum]
MLRKRTGQKFEEQENNHVSDIKAKNKVKHNRLFWKLLLVIIFVVYIIIPFSVYLSPAVRRHAVFLNYVSLSRQKNLSLPSESGLKCTRNFYVSSEGSIKLGVWHIPAHFSLSKCKDGHIPEGEEFNDEQPIFLYLHGNAGTRSGGHRVELYKVLSEKLNSHVIAFDYRGFGDSTNESPSEQGLVKDTESMYNWLRKRVKSSRIYIWGHSLGTGVSVAFLNSLSTSKDQPGGLILEAPFTRIIDAARHHPLSIFHRYMPFFETLIAEPIGDKDTAFDSINRIGNVKCPILILHAEDDGFVPFDQGKELYERALATRKISDHITKFVGFDRKLDLGHKHIFQNPDLPIIIKEFIDSVQQKSK